VGVYTRFKVLLDDAAENPGLHFGDYASALSEMIVHSRADFAVGVFGGWGSGKTTLMRAIERELAANSSVVTVWFSAWRYEREAHLIVPLIDVLREALDDRATTNAGDGGAARRAAAAMGRAGEAFLAGLTLSAGLPGVMMTWEPHKVLESLKSKTATGAEPLSFYHAGFNMLRDAIKDFSAGGARRIVVFIDDLDRCLPANALDVLESMKLFFDVPGFVFVVGLDQAIVERAVAYKYRGEPGRRDDELQVTPVSGTDYVKKIFQVPFALPSISTDLLQDYLRTVADNAGLEGEQLEDFQQNVCRHLEFLPGEDPVNPREIKRLINAYTLQLKMLSTRLGDRLDPNIVLALQVMSFRRDWRYLYDHLAADPQLFQSILRDALIPTLPPDALWLSGSRVAITAQFVEYVYGSPLVDSADLSLYVSTAESTRSSNPSLLEAQIVVNRLRQSSAELDAGGLSPAEAASKITVDFKRLNSVLPTGLPIHRTLDALYKATEELNAAITEAGEGTEAAQRWIEKATPLLDILDSAVRQTRHQANFGATG
jgi:KAP family P-loop domain